MLSIPAQKLRFKLLFTPEAAKIHSGELRVFATGLGRSPRMELTYDTIAKRIDHSLLSPSLTDVELVDGCRLAARYRVASVCIKPSGVALAAEILRRTGVAVGTTIGFPHGGHVTAVKGVEGGKGGFRRAGRTRK